MYMQRTDSSTGAVGYTASTEMVREGKKKKKGKKRGKTVGTRYIICTHLRLEMKKKKNLFLASFFRGMHLSVFSRFLFFLEVFSSGTCRCIRRSSRSYKCRERIVWGGLTVKCVASEEEQEPRRCKVLEGSHSRLCIARNANATEEVDKEGAALQTSERALRTRPADKVAYSEGQSSYPKKQFPSANSTKVPTKSSAGTQGKRKKKPTVRT